MTRRVCHDCGSSSAETAFPAARFRPGQIPRCSDCVAAAPTADRVAAHRAAVAAGEVHVIRRASYRAAYRHRWTLPQLDLVDLLVPPP
jgi:hypothetical protein